VTRIRFGGSVVTNDFWKERVSSSDKSLETAWDPAEFRWFDIDAEIDIVKHFRFVFSRGLARVKFGAETHRLAAAPISISRAA
jgi:hypothetical protein